MKRLFIIFASIIIAVSGSARTVTDFFADSIAQVPNLSKLTRLDMVDYFASGLQHSSQNDYAGPVRIYSSNGKTMTFDINEATPCSLSVLTAQSDTVLMYIETVRLPQPDSSISFFDKNWKPLKRTVFVEPKLDDWLTNEGKSSREDVESWLPFLLWSAAYDDDTATLTLTSTLNQYFAGADDINRLNKWLLPKLTYQYKGKKFTLVK